MCIYQVSNTPLKLDGKLINEETVQTRKESTSSSSTDSESSNDRQQKSNKRQRKYSEESQEEKENESDSEDSSSNEYGSGEVTGTCLIQNYNASCFFPFLSLSISDDESWNLVTCYCGRPFAGRPMIECSKCLTWIHLYCARIKKDSVPDYFLCQICKSKTKKKSTK